MATLVDYALTNVDDVKELLGIASSDHSKDNLIIRKINQVTDMIERYTGRRFKLSQYTEYQDASHIDEMTLKNRPVVIDDDHTFSSGRRDTSLNDDDFDTTEANLYFVDKSSGIVKLNYFATGHWQRYRFNYWAGYATIPNDLAEAAASLAAYFVQDPSGALVGLASRKEGQREVRYSNSSSSGSLNFSSIAQQLGVDATLNAYSNLPLISEQ